MKPMLEDSSRFTKRFIKFEKPEDVEGALCNGPVGARVLYHTGFLMCDAQHKYDNSTSQSALRALRTQLQKNYDKGAIDLVQRRLAEYTYEYYAIRTRQPQVRDYFFPTMYGVVTGSAGQVG